MAKIRIKQSSLVTLARISGDCRLPHSPYRNYQLFEPTIGEVLSDALKYRAENMKIKKRSKRDYSP